MSSLEYNITGIISALQNGTKNFISPQDQSQLATWATKTAILIRYLHKTPLVPKCREKWLFVYKTPPPDTSVWMARYDGDFKATIQTSDIFSKHSNELPCGQVVDFSIGCLLFRVVSIYLPNTIKMPDHFAKNFTRVWPVNSQFLWPSFGLDDSSRSNLLEVEWRQVVKLQKPLIFDCDLPWGKSGTEH